MKKELSNFTALTVIISILAILTGFTSPNSFTNQLNLDDTQTRFRDTGITDCGVSGTVRTEGNEAVSDITVSARVNGLLVAYLPTYNGSFFTFYSCYPTSTTLSTVLSVSKNNNDDITRGVTTFDISKISRHIFGIEPLASPYKLIAADANQSGDIDALDLLYLRRLILKLSPNIPAGNFRFVDKAYRFINPENPFDENFPEFIKLDSSAVFKNHDFVAVKIGDVNDSYSSTIIRGSNKLIFNAHDMDIEAGHAYTVDITAAKLDVSAFQGTLCFDGAEVKSVKAGNLNNLEEGNFGVFKNAITVSWNGKAQETTDVLSINFIATKSGKLSEILIINSVLTQAVAHDAIGKEMNIELNFNADKRVGEGFKLYQNYPNPMFDETIIGFNLTNDSPTCLTITNMNGKVVKIIKGNYKAGYNSITIRKNDLETNGFFFYRLENNEFSETKKMVVFN